VTARADSARYRLGKFVSRHRVGVGAALLLALSLVGGIAASMREARVAEAQRQRAERRFADVRKLANSFMFDVHDEIRDLPGSTKARERLVATAREYLDSLAQEAHGDAGLQRELAGAYERLGDVQGGFMVGNLGDTQSALDGYRKALAIRDAIAAGQRQEPEDSLALARVQMRAGDVYRTMNRLPEAETTYRSVTLRLEALGAPVVSDAILGALGDAYGKLAEVQVQLGRAEPARSAVEKAIEHGEAFGQLHPENARAQLNLATAYYVDAECLRAAAEFERALHRVRQARTIHEALLEKDPLNQQLVRALLFSLNREAASLRALERPKEAVPVNRRAAEHAEQMLRRDPRDRWAQVAVMVADSSLGSALIHAGEHGEALRRLRKGREIAARVVKEDPRMGFARNELAVIDANLGSALLEQGTETARREACQAFARSLETWRAIQADGPLTADSAAGLRDVEGRMAACRPMSW
jgi:non-specific serine/threonine protein kinase/serine/threonine-protein kinase